MHETNQQLDANGANSDGTPTDPAVEFAGGIFAATDDTQTIAYVFTAPRNTDDAVTINDENGPNQIHYGATDYAVASTTEAIRVRTDEGAGGTDTAMASPRSTAGRKSRDYCAMNTTYMTSGT